MTVGSAPACARNGRSGSGVGGRFELVLALPLSACWMKDTIGRRPLPDVSQNIVIEPRKTCGRRERGNMGEGGGGTYVGLPGEQADEAALLAVHDGEHDDVHAGDAEDDARGGDGTAGFSEIGSENAPSGAQDCSDTDSRSASSSDTGP